MVNFRDPAVVAKEARASSLMIPITVLEVSLTPCLYSGCYQVLERSGWYLLVGPPRCDLPHISTSLFQLGISDDT